MDYKQNLISLLLLIILSLLLTSCDSYNQELNKPIICFTFDDGHLNAFENAFPLFKQFSFTATSFLNSGKIGNPGKISWSNIDSLVSHGWEIAGHTIDHVDLAELDDDEAYYQIIQDYHNFTNQGIELSSFALPGGHATLRDYDIIKGVYKNIRNSIDKEMHTPLNRFDLGYFAYQTNYRAEDVKQRIIRGYNNGESLIVIGFHRISEEQVNTVANCKTDDLEEILSWVYSNNFPVMTLEEAVNKLNK